MSQSTQQPANTVFRRKLVIVGDGFIGKTTLFEVFTHGYFPTRYVPTVFENYITDCQVDGKSVQLALWDTAGQEEYERLRPLSYSKADVMLIGFAVNSCESFEHAIYKWADEVAGLCPNVPIILVGLKLDLREDPIVIEEWRRTSQKFVNNLEALEMATAIGAKKYLECSSLTGEGVDNVFEAATRAAIAKDDTDASRCCILL